MLPISELGNLFSPAIIPEDPPNPLKAEIALLAAVLCRLIMDATGNTGEEDGGYIIQKEALETLHNDESTTPFSFMWICEQLDLNPQIIRYFVLKQTKPLYFKHIGKRNKKKAA